MSHYDPLLTKELADAATEGDASRVEALLARGVHPNDYFSAIDCPLFRAVDEGQLAIVLLLLRHGARLNRYHLDARHAAYCGHVEVLDVMLDASAKQSANIKQAHAWAGEAAQSAGEALCETDHWAELPSGAQRDILISLIARGLDVNHVYKGDTTMLASAAYQGNAKLVRQLIAAGAGADVARARAALNAAVQRSHVEAAQVLLELGVPVDDARATTLLAAVGATDIQQGADSPPEALARAASVVKLLLEWGADPTTSKHAAVRTAAANGLADIVVMFVNAVGPLDDGEVWALRSIAEGNNRQQVVAVLDAFEQAQALHISRIQSGPPTTPAPVSRGVRL